MGQADGDALEFLPGRLSTIALTLEEAVSLPEENRNLVRRYIEEGMNAGDESVIAEVFAADYVNHQRHPGQAEGREGLVEGQRLFRNAFPDFRLTIEDMVAEGDLVAARMTGEGHHSGGVFMGIEPTGDAFRSGIMAFFRVAEGKIVERWAQDDRAELLSKLRGSSTPTTSDA